VSVFDYGSLPDGGAYLVMELVRGEDLRRLMEREGRLEAPRALQIIVSVCSAIEAAHREGVLHRDLKPENILLTGGGAGVKVLDFGVAKLLSEERATMPDAADGSVVTMRGAILGTPAYMAPEQLRAEPLDTRSDVFSLGVIAYEMLAGRLPFGRGGLVDIVLQQSRGVPPMNDEDDVVPLALERAIRSALAPDPAARPVSPAAFAGLLQTAAGLQR
jgi:serine/threonine-protein kinase